MFVATGAGCLCRPRGSRYRSRANVPVLASRLPSNAHGSPDESGLYWEPAKKRVRLCLEPAKKRVRALLGAREEIGSNLSEMNTYAKCAANPCAMCTYKIIGLKVSCHEHLQKIGGGGRLLLPNHRRGVPKA